MTSWHVHREFAVTTALLIVGGVSFVAGRSAPPPLLDPLGAGAFPMGLGALLVLCAIINLGRLLWRIDRLAFLRELAAFTVMRRRISEEAKESAKKFWMSFGTVIFYVILIDYFSIPFLIASPIFLISCYFVLEIGSLKQVFLSILSYSILVAFLEWATKNIFYIDLP